MKKRYPILRDCCFLIFFILISLFTTGQCLNGYEPTGKGFDTTVTTGGGNYESFFTFPKFHPDSGMVTCVRLTMTMTGIVRKSIENYVNAPTTYNSNYSRRDTITGPGLSGPLQSNVSKAYGPFNLAANDNVSFSGPDFIQVGPDTVLKNVSVVHTITDVNEISNFYGLDSLTYRYAIKVDASIAGSGDYLFSVITSGFVNFRLDYCYCPPTVLPAGLRNFQVEKKNEQVAALSWQSETDTSQYVYEVQVSRDGKNFERTGIVSKSAGHNPAYTFHYEKQKHESGLLYFRVKQLYKNGYIRFTTVKSVEFNNSLLSRISMYPNPSSGIVGIRFDNVVSGKISIRIANVQGQTIVSRDMTVAGTDYKQVATLQRGMYWLRITDAVSGETTVNQLLIK